MVGVRGGVGSIRAGKPDPIEGENWRAIPAGPGAGRFRWYLYLNSHSRQRPYPIAFYVKLGWQAWWNGMPVTGYVSGTLEEALPVLVEQLRITEVEQMLDPSGPLREYVSQAMTARVRKARRFEKQVKEALSQEFREFPHLAVKLGVE